ncbi:CBS domain-containing protein [Oceanispirochaeta crateris]|uniref:CBS domain-containing protein n=1 Tax=Oceanispirochaeta crateris TaxID=2518645 RepID=A0A5C1QIM7_9SPIO|nr:cation:proton antiporter [Oceanispirochaeta crateris]QEN06880.1 CBS domain-containing protein [Oceanispirochaeta crateris]
MMIDFIIEHVTVEHLNLIFLMGIILFGGTYVGRLFQKWKIPQVVGYICLGVILGKTGFNIISLNTLESLQPFNFFALGLIGFMIGGELRISTLKKFGKQFSTILVLESLGAFFIVSALMIGMGLLFFEDKATAISFGLLMGAISSATAPAATTDVLWENKTRGPLTTMVLGIVAMDDAFALLLFALASSVAGLLTGQGDISLGYSLMELVWEIGAAILVGLLAGTMIKRAMKSFVDDDKILAFTVGAILLIIGTAQLLKVDMILASMTLGFFVTNNIPQRSKKTFHLVEKFTPPVYILFFVLVGAKLDVTGLTFMSVILALIYIIGRIAGKAIGAILGSSLSKAPKTVRKYLPFCLLSQAGVAIGLSIVAGQTFKGPIGDTIILVITATTFVVQIIGPAFVKYAVTKSGEAGLNVTEEDLILQSKAGDLADKEIPMIREDETLKGILRIFAERDNLYYPVVNKEGILTGILSIDKLKDTFISSEFSDFLLAHDIMDKVVYKCTLETSAAEIYNFFKKSHIASVPLVDKEGHAEGIIEYRRIQQLISRRLSEFEHKAVQMEEV